MLRHIRKVKHTIYLILLCAKLVMAEEDTVPVEELQKLEVEDGDELTPGYKAPAKVDLQTIQDLDADDESLQKYKKELLGGKQDILDEGGNNVLVKALRIIVEGREDLVIDLTGNLSDLKVTMKEGVKYRLKIVFRVQREIVSGLRFLSQVKRKGIKVDSSNHMVGSYGPKTEEHSFLAPMEDAPSGMIARGVYNIHSKFTDDDKNIYLEWDWAMTIAKNWK
uniref:Rho GDP-dissociation inhibitor 3 n=1 Tax=Phallusia mammillata TaxID=59560 RepID=A0A6F9D5Z7_9ASCI|nr:rho GDP-dissociation inhibitor 1-like [Phallusia mammillata]